MKFTKKIKNTSNIILLITALVIIVIIGVLIREQIKNKWISNALFGNKNILSRENFSGTAQKYKVDAGVYALKHFSGPATKILEPNHDNSTAEFISKTDTTTYDINNTLYYSKPKDKWYSLKTGTEYDWNYFKLGMLGHIKVESGAGTNRDWFVRFKNNGQDIQGEGSIGSRGLNMIAIPAMGNGSIKRRAFDALGSGSFQSQMDQFINDTMQDHSIFLLGVLDEAGQQNYEGYYYNLSNRISAPEFKKLTWRASYAYIGIKLGDNNYERVGEARAPDGAAISAPTNVETRFKQYYIFPSISGPNPERNGPIKHRSVDYIPVAPNNYNYHNIPDGEYNINGLGHDIYIAQIPNTIQHYNVYKIEGSNGNRTMTRESDGPYTIISKRNNNNTYTTHIFKNNGQDYVFNATMSKNLTDHNISFTYKNRIRHNFLIKNNGNNYLGFQPTLNSILKTFSYPTPNTVLKDGPEHMIVKLLKYNNDTRHAIVFFTAKKILYVKADGNLGFEDITDNNIIQNFRTNNNINNYPNYSNDKYKFNIMPAPAEMSSGGQTGDGSIIIFHRTIASPSSNANYTDKIVYKYLSVNNGVLKLINSTTFKTGSELGNEYKFVVTEITDPNDNDNLECVLINYYKTSTEGSADFVHINNRRDNPNGESNCRFINLFRRHENNCTPNGEGCLAYNPAYIETQNNHKRVVGSNYNHIPNRKIGSSNKPLLSYNNKSINQCIQECDANEDCYVFTFKDNLNDNPVTLGECNMYSYGDAGNKVDDNSYDYYQLLRTAEIKQIIETPVPTRVWTAEEKAYSNSPCGSATTGDACATMSNTCRFARGRCNPLCENTATGCVSNKIETIGSVSDFNISLALELLGNKQIKVTIMNVELVDRTKKFSFPIIKSDGITVEFVKSGNIEYGSNRTDNKKITVNYVIDYTSTASQYKFINPNDEFIIDIPAVLCSPNCDKLREHGIKIIFTDIYGRTKSFQQFLPPEIVTSVTQPLATEPHDDMAIQQIRVNQDQINQYLSQ